MERQEEEEEEAEAEDEENGDRKEGRRYSRGIPVTNRR